MASTKTQLSKANARLLRDFRKRYAEQVARGARDFPAWASSPRSQARGRYTWYAEIRARTDIRGEVSDLVVAEAKGPPRLVTVALLGVYKTGARRGELHRLTRVELARDFEELVAKAIRRHGIVTAGPDYLRAVWRHKEA